MTTTATPEVDPLLPLWRAAQAFRLVSLAYAIAVQITSDADYAHPYLSWALVAVEVLWTGVAVVCLTMDVHRRTVVCLELALVLGLVFSSWLVAPVGFWVTHESLPTTLWCANVVVSAGLLWGAVAGAGVGLVVALAVNTVSSQLSDPPWRDASIPVLMAIGFAIGVLGRTAVRANEQLRAAVEVRVATEERERLARQVHDGALQVLALVARREGAVDPQLAALADEQQRALRGYLSRLPPPRHPAPVVGSGVVAHRPRSGRSAPGRRPATVDPQRAPEGGGVDVAARLTALEAPSVRVSVPPGPVVLPEPVAEELVAAARAALHNVTVHAGAGATAYVLVEDLAEKVVVSVRDDGPGIPSGRLAEAARGGRLGVRQSIRGRLESLGGTAELVTAPGEGTEWELHVPRAREDR